MINKVREIGDDLGMVADEITEIQKRFCKMYIESKDPGSDENRNAFEQLT